MFPIRDHNPSERVAYVTYALIVANVVIFAVTAMVFADHAALSRLYWDYAFIPAKLSSGEGVFGLITSQFLHGGFLHLAGNMLFLWIYGDNMEDTLGHAGFLLFYLAGGVFAALAQYLADPGSAIPMVGASGAIAAVMGGYLLFFPRAKVDFLLFLIIFIRIFSIPAWAALGLWFGMQVFAGFGADTEAGGVAYWAHAGGFVFGLLAVLPFWLRRGGAEYWRRTEGHPPHPEARYPFVQSRVPNVPRKR